MTALEEAAVYLFVECRVSKKSFNSNHGRMRTRLKIAG